MDGARRHTYPESEQSQQARQPSSSPTMTYSYLSTAPLPVLPSIATFLHPHQAPCARHYQYQQSSDPAAYPPFVERISRRASPPLSSLLTLSEFQHITLGTPSLSIRSSILPSSDNVARMQTSYKPKATVTTSRVATSSNNSTSSGWNAAPSRPVRTSRYLRESDRRNILSRIAKGERQADLAKEFQVSRAAISNLKQRRNKSINNRLEEEQQGEENHSERESGQGRDEHSDDEKTRGGDQSSVHESPVLTAERKVSGEIQQQQVASRFQSSEFELKRHAGYSSDSASEHDVHSSPPYLPSPALVPQSPLSPVRHDEELEGLDEATRTLMLERVTEVGSPSMELLFTRLVGPCTDAHTFQVALSRAARLLLEHAQSMFPTRNVQIPVCQQSLAPGYFTGAEAARPSCAVTVPKCGGAALLHEFQAIEPQSGVGVVSPRANGGQLPRHVHESNVLVLVDLLDAQSSVQLVHGLQALVQRGVPQHSIVLVTICSDEQVVARVLQAFPGLRVITSKIFGQDSESMGLELYGLLHARLLFQNNRDDY